MAGDVTKGFLKRLSYIDGRPGEYDGGTLIAGQEYFDVAFTGGDISNVTLTNVNINGLVLNTPLTGQYGGTGVANTGKTITLGGNLTTSGAFNTTLTSTGTTTVTLPTTGTLSTLAGAEALTNKSVNGVTLTTAGAATSFLNATGSYTTPSGPTGQALTKTDDTNVTLTLGGSPTTALLSASSLTLGWTGTLASTRGGTGTGTTAVGDLLQGGATNTWTKLAAVATGNVLISGGVEVASSWGKVGLTTHVSGTLPVTSGGTGLTTGTTAYAPVFTGTTATGNFQTGTAGTVRQVLTSNGASALPTFQTPIFSQEFTSSNQSLTAGGLLTIAHGFGVVPKFIIPYYYCVTATQGWSIGDIYQATFYDMGAGSTLTLQASDSTNIYVRVGNGTITIVNKGSGASIADVNARWNAFFKVYA